MLNRHGRDALTTRAVAQAAHVQPPVLYRLFHDKTGLLSAVADFGFRTYLARKRPPETTEDPVQALRLGWQLHVDFGLSHPALYLLMYADPQPGPEGEAARTAHGLLRDHIRQVAVANRLRVSEEWAAHLFHAAAFGIVMTLLTLPPEQRDPSLAALACETALRSITTDPSTAPAATVGAAATHLRALMGQADISGPPEGVLTAAERGLLGEWLRRMADSSANSS